MESDLSGKYTFDILPSEVDFKGKLTLPNLTNYILNAAGYHACECGFGMSEINQSNRSWVLSRLVIEMMSYPKQYEKIQVQTWVENVMRMFTMRNFAIMDEEGKILGYARTVWAMIDLITRKPSDLTQTNIPDFICKKECPIEKSGKIPFLEGKPKEKFTIKYSDIDINQHLTSSKYVEHIIDAFNLKMFEKREIHRFEIEFMSEGKFGETISLYKEDNTDNEFFIELKNEAGNTLSKSKMTFS